MSLALNCYSPRLRLFRDVISSCSLSFDCMYKRVCGCDVCCYACAGSQPGQVFCHKCSGEGPGWQGAEGAGGGRAAPCPGRGQPQAPGQCFPCTPSKSEVTIDMYLLCCQGEDVHPQPACAINGTRLNLSNTPGMPKSPVIQHVLCLLVASVCATVYPEVALIQHFTLACRRDECLSPAITPPVVPCHPTAMQASLEAIRICAVCTTCDHWC